MSGLLTAVAGILPTAGGGGGSIAVTSFSNGTNVAFSGISFTLPTSVSDGNLLVVGIASESSTVTPPSGWSPVGTINVGASRISIFSKIAASETGPYAFSGGSFFTGSIINITGNTASPIDVVGAGNGGTGGTATAFGITTSQVNELVLYFSGSDGSGSMGIPSGFTDCGNATAGSNEGYAAGWIVQASQGATGNLTAAAASPWTTMLISVLHP